MDPDAPCFPLVDFPGFSIPKRIQKNFKHHSPTAEGRHRLKQMRRIGSVEVIFLLAGHCWWNQDVSQDVSRDVLLEQTTRHFLEFFLNKISLDTMFRSCASVFVWVKLPGEKSHVFFKDGKTQVTILPRHDQVTFSACGPPKAPAIKVYRWAWGTIRIYKCQFVGVGSSFPTVSCFLIFWI